jgi:hypothetical protein
VGNFIGIRGGFLTAACKQGDKKRNKYDFYDRPPHTTSPPGLSPCGLKSELDEYIKMRTQCSFLTGIVQGG